ncbi:uncharacterized protein F5891DRAFT_1196409 [Suillus fuscotomentosus]|uniref:Protein-S-isoprenylcysteine O-methyltransferase n=1 Tax=Suillus fuscotomentosus TaxID=1912939 RepID=A0AAD4DTA6_9AGAM|nr:uncharacterized protein F5891DRAFT_1196409 [Suillus fuscotomentosus]KAG1893461.1 hypothetical protein F5891DRAFT_1196409 [Suillus fuscotomentosus]
MSLLKIPLILSSAVAVHVALTPPHAPSKSEVVHDTFNEWVIIQHVRYGLPISKIVYWGISLAEIALIVSRMTDLKTLPSDVPITRPFILGTALVASAGYLRWSCFRTLGHFFTFELTARKGHQLVTSGPYSIVRHPSYAAAILQYIGVTVLHGSATSWVRQSGVLDLPGVKLVLLAWLLERTITVTSLVRRINQEEEVVKSMFGDEWQRWANAVRYRIIPGIY